MVNLSYARIYLYSEAFRDPSQLNILTYETLYLYFADKNQFPEMYGFKASFKVVGKYINEPDLICILKSASLK